MDNFTLAYVEAALWSSYGDDGTPLNSNYGIADLAPETVVKMREDCENFQLKCRIPEYKNPNWSDEAMAGHDFWLTRNRQGVGFWDRNLGEQGERLTRIAREFGEVYLYVGDDGKVYQG